MPPRKPPTTWPETSPPGAPEERAGGLHRRDAAQDPPDDGPRAQPAGRAPRDVAPAREHALRGGAAAQGEEEPPRGVVRQKPADPGPEHGRQAGHERQD